MDELISVVIPIYNSEKSIERCVDSIINQTYKNLEILLINDGSRDNSLALCHMLESKDKRIKVFSHDNKGVSYTRNFGLSTATGTFLMFVDSDDIVDVTTCEKLYNKIVEEKADMCFCRFAIVTDGVTKNEEERQLANMVENSDIKYLALYGKDNVMGSACRTLFRKDKIYNRFSEELTLEEDCVFMMELIADRNIKKVLVDEYLYFYFIEKTSAGKYINDNYLSQRERMVFAKKKIMEKNCDISFYNYVAFHAYTSSVLPYIYDKKQLKNILNSSSMTAFRAKVNYLAAQQYDDNKKLKLINYLCYKKYYGIMRLIMLVRKTIKGILHKD